jgi:hypothetical protein
VVVVVVVVVRCRAKPGATRLQRRNDAIDVITNKTKPSVGCELLDDAAEGHLSRLRHSVCFVQYHELELAREYSASGGKVFDLFANNVEFSVVTGVELENLLPARDNRLSKMRLGGCK